jgi:mannose-6-phosphate isomerase-like protein (cupin superfamily)
MSTTTDTRALWMLNSLLVERATAADTNGQYTLLEQWITADGNPPPHVHEREDEGFLVVEGQVDVTVGDTTTRLGPGGFAFAPRGVPHTYAIVEGTAHLFAIATPGGIEHFFRELGEPAGELALPAPTQPDGPFIAATAARHGMTILPPAE